MFRQKKLSILTVLLSLVALGAIACGQGESERVEITLALDWFPNSNHLGLFIAQEKGYFEDENLDVTVYTPADPSTVLATVGAGSDDFGISYQPDVLLARAQGVPVVSVAGMVEHPLNSLMALKSSGITRPGDLKGKKVGYPGIPTNEQDQVFIPFFTTKREGSGIGLSLSRQIMTAHSGEIAIRRQDDRTVVSLVF